MDRLAIAQMMREHAERMRRIASIETQLSPQLMRLARELDAEADKLEAAAKKNLKPVA